MWQRNRKGRWLVRMGVAWGVVGALVATVLQGCSSGKKGPESRFAFDPSLYEDRERARLPVEKVVRKAVGFQGQRPNIILILTDDLGYGDLGCYGSRAIRTPNIDRLAREGVRFTDFYSANALCSPSRAGLLTGRYPHRTGITWPFPSGQDTFSRNLLRRVGRWFGSLGILDTQGARNITSGLPASEITIAEALKVAGYRTACIGKWHLGDFVKDPRYLPRKHGFDYFIGFNGANDDWPVAFWRNETELVKDIGLDQARYTGLFTREAIAFIERAKDGPFFLYLAHKDPHQPCIPSEGFENRSEGGRYGDTVEEVDWSVGEIRRCLERNGLDRNTIVLFTSDNGPWYNGSPGPLRGRKGQSFEGGYRVPMIAWWPGRIPQGRICREPSMSIDLFPTFLRLGGLAPPRDRIIDGKDLWGLLSGNQEGPLHEALFFFHHNELEGLRVGKWKYFRYIDSYVYPVPLDKPHTLFGRLAGNYRYRPEGSEVSVPALGSWPLLYNMDLDPGESYNLLKKYPEVASRMRDRMEAWERAFVENPRGWLPGKLAIR